MGSNAAPGSVLAGDCYGAGPVVLAETNLKLLQVVYNANM